MHMHTYIICHVCGDQEDSFQESILPFHFAHCRLAGPQASGRFSALSSFVTGVVIVRELWINDFPGKDSFAGTNHHHHIIMVETCTFPTGRLYIYVPSLVSWINIPIVLCRCCHSECGTWGRAAKQGERSYKSHKWVKGLNTGSVGLWVKLRFSCLRSKSFIS